MAIEKVKVGDSIKAECAQCGGSRNCEIKGLDFQTIDDEIVTVWINRYILKCLGCDSTFFMESVRHSEDTDVVEYPDGSYAHEPIERLSYWPARLKREIPVWFPKMQSSQEFSSRLDQPLHELYLALNNDLRMLSAIAVRTCFDVASEICGVSESHTFEEKIKELLTLGRIGISDKYKLDALVEGGSASAHRSWIPESGELNTLVNLLEDFLQNVFVAPIVNKELEIQTAELKTKIPQKQKRIKRQKIS